MDTDDSTTPFDATGLDEYGWLYYPNQCISGGCHFGVVLHGCFMRAIDFVARSGVTTLPYNDEYAGWTSVAY